MNAQNYDFGYVHVDGTPLSEKVHSFLVKSYTDFLAKATEKLKPILATISIRHEIIDRQYGDRKISNAFDRLVADKILASDDVGVLLDDVQFALERRFHRKLFKIRPFSLEEAKEVVQEFNNEVNEDIENLKSEIDTFASKLAEAPAGADMGQWLFASSRSDAPLEKDTKPEVELKVDLQKHFSDERKLSDITADVIKKHVKDDEYTNLLRFPEEEFSVVYRGMSMSLAEFENVFGFVPDEGETGGDLVDIMAKPRLDTASWTVDVTQAEFFSSLNRTHEKPMSVILAARVSSNSGKFLLNPNKIYNIRPFDEFNGEQETIGVGPIAVYKMIYARYPANIKKIISQIES